MSADEQREAWIQRQLEKAPPPPRAALQVLSGVLSRPAQGQDAASQGHQSRPAQGRGRGMTSKKPPQKRHETAQEWADRVIREHGPIPDHLLREVRDQLHIGRRDKGQKIVGRS